MAEIEGQGRPITLRLGADVVPAAQFKSAVDAFVELIQEVTGTFAQGLNEKVSWGIAVREGSAVINAFPSSTNLLVMAALTDTITRGLVQLEAGNDERPEYFTDKALGAARRLSKITSDDMSVSLSTVGVSAQLSEQTAVTISKALDAKYSDYGTLDGYIEVISNRGNIKATLYDDLTDRPVRCTFESEALEKVFGLMKLHRKVEVSGLISYRVDGIPVRIQVDRYKAFPDSSTLPSIREIVGIFKDN